MASPLNALAKKLLVKPGMTVCVIAAPAGYDEILDPLPTAAKRVDISAEALDTVVADEKRPADVVLAFAQDAAALAHLATSVMGAVRPGGVLWIAYRKGGAKAGTDLNRYLVHDVLEPIYGWTGVALVAVDERWSAMRFRPREMMGT